MNEVWTPKEYEAYVHSNEARQAARLQPARLQPARQQPARQQPARQQPARQQPERGMQRRLMEWAQRFDRWVIVWHDEDSRRNEAGMPDLWVVGEPYLLVAELKCQGRKPTPEQRLFLDMQAWATSACPTAYVCLWREEHEAQALRWLGDPQGFTPPGVWEGE